MTKYERSIGMNSLIQWVSERYENCTRIAAEKTGTDRAGWLEDADYFRAVLRALQREERLCNGLQLIADGTYTERGAENWAKFVLGMRAST